MSDGMTQQNRFSPGTRWSACYMRWNISRDMHDDENTPLCRFARHAPNRARKQSKNLAKFYVLCRFNSGKHWSVSDYLRSVFATITIFVSICDLLARNSNATNCYGCSVVRVKFFARVIETHSNCIRYTCSHALLFCLVLFYYYFRWHRSVYKKWHARVQIIIESLNKRLSTAEILQNLFAYECSRISICRFTRTRSTIC